MDAMISDAILWEVVGADFLGTVAGTDERFARIGGVGAIFGDFALEEATAKYGHSLDTVLLLRALVLHSNNEAGRQVRDANGRVGGVDALATMATGAVDIDAEILGIDFEVLLFRLWEDGDCRGASMDAALGFGNWDALNAVDAAFELEFAVGLVAADAENYLFVAASIVDGFGLELDLEAVCLGVTEIHAIEVARKEASLVAAGAGANFNDGWFVVVRVARNEHFGEFGLGLLEFGLEIWLHFGEFWVLVGLGDIFLELLALSAESDKLIDLLETAVFGGKIRISISVWLTQKVRELLAFCGQSIKIYI